MKGRTPHQGYLRQVLCTECHQSAPVRGGNRRELRAAEEAWRAAHKCVGAAA